MGFKKRETLLILAAVVCITVLLGDKFVISPMINLWKSRAERITLLKQSLEKGEFLVEREEGVSSLLQDMKDRSLAGEKSDAENQVLNSVNDWARVSGLNVTSLKPRWIDDEQEAKKLEFRLSASGDMGSVSRFLYELERDPLALRLEDVEISVRDARGRELELTARFTGLILVKEES